ncbi:MAG: transcriptional regulator [Candidatus Dactylopiibacterium carminicum]|uniref:Transcriptional regulator n=1 Tax=Candidatus Dactylopiibacterium carminicum TaxID=857335 RepID=A0A272EQW0_9RHOO|nr:helix-turn-helix transcriptional regulator [Candidatus Dactylopiibacterium carminicum]KAF7600719.1 XRE family transcriptional regulator [Candidatus Dactylopiibacterium carminicum]PAS92478.1 MAG: transcriptional regulator [Candidatus Dactylopiibacterium carminicum]PAT00725.1 MAG: transcriptional regulator [Candidatus Dactylopiibacterium carminicum]
MDEASKLIDCAKRMLRQQGLTYRDVAVALGLAEASVKRMFSIKRMTLDRLMAVANLLGVSIAELAQEAAEQERRIRTLDATQETELVSNPKLLLVAVCTLNQWRVQDIMANYALSEAEVISLLLRLDKLRLLDVLPGNRVRLNVTRDFDWLPHGPIRGFFARNGLGDFFDGGFGGEDEYFAFAHGMLTESALGRLHEEARRVRAKLAELHEESLAVPLHKRHGVGFVLAFRQWELGAFRSLRRAETAEEAAP